MTPAIVLLLLAASEQPVIDVEDVEPFTSEERQRIEAEGSGRRADSEAHWSEFNRRLDRLHCTNGVVLLPNSISWWERPHWSIGRATKLNDGRGALALSASLTVLDATWRCSVPSRAQIEAAGLGGLEIDWVIAPARYQLSAAVGADQLSVGGEEVRRLFLKGSAGAGFIDSGHPGADLSLSIGPTLAPSGVGFGLSVSLGIYFLQIEPRLQLSDGAAHWWLITSIRDPFTYLFRATY